MFVGQQSAAYVYLKNERGLPDFSHNLEWSSTAPEILSIARSEDGRVTVNALATGNATLRVECKELGLSQERTLRIAEEPHIEWF